LLERIGAGRSAKYSMAAAGNHLPTWFSTEATVTTSTTHSYQSVPRQRIFHPRQW